MPPGSAVAASEVRVQADLARLAPAPGWRCRLRREPRWPRGGWRSVSGVYSQRACELTAEESPRWSPMSLATQAGRARRRCPWLELGRRNPSSAAGAHRRAQLHWVAPWLCPSGRATRDHGGEICDMRPVLRREVRSDLAPLFTMTGSAVPGIKTFVQGALAATNARQAFSSAHSRAPPPAGPAGRWPGIREMRRCLRMISRSSSATKDADPVQ